jgi:hypothetical protein
VNYFLIALSDHAPTIKVIFESGKVRENRVRKPYGWDGIELGTRALIKDPQIEMNKWPDQWVPLQIPADQKRYHD